MNKTNEDYIEEFHKAFGVSIKENPSIKILKLRKTLIDEEVKEFFIELDSMIKKLEKGEEIPKGDFEKALAEMADIQVVLSGTAVAIKQFENFREAFLRKHKSNMSKLGEDGKPILREDGKILKGPNYKEADLSGLI
ncbi:MAG: nucleoside triphosphate pyrophosphohydrolase family protein [Candidatus Pacebacteria bacterium]|nr:nucleoside triphosphate pyrophosphohydrolase family protein [Candidatus Paceibacterota bacterium]